jgi:two-component system sensor histidine kinase BaeS
MKGVLAKILAAQVISVLLALLVMLVATRISLQQGFIDFLERQEAAVLENLAPALAQIYEAQGGWDVLRDSPRHWQRILRHSSPLHGGRRGPPGPPPQRHRYAAPDGEPEGLFRAEPPLRWLRTLDRLQLRDRLFLLDADRAWVAGPRNVEWAERTLVAVESGGATLGWIGFAPLDRVRPPEVRRFLGSQLRTLVISLVAALGLAAALGFLLARHLSRPVRELEDTVRALSHGDYGRRAAVTTGDEIGRLAVDINHLADTLEKNRSSRRRWMADIAHELRTPVAVLKGEIEAITDGVRNPDERALQSLSEEIDQLSVLVGDLQTLAMADAGALNLHREPLELGALLRQVGESFRERLAAREVGLELPISEEAFVTADAKRLRQLVQNLLENCARYVETGGRVRISMSQAGGDMLLTVEDSGPGVPEPEREMLFERLYRVERGRSRTGGGSGLGLAICKNIVEAHGGRIEARASALGGLAIEIRLPG